MTDTQSKIKQAAISIGELVAEKNRKYGNSALEPVQIFSKIPAADQILNRLDDKLGRVKNSTEIRKNDVADIMGYLILLCVKNGWTDFKELED